jgi:hypothetical protein
MFEESFTALILVVVLVLVIEPGVGFTTILNGVNTP